MSIRASPKYAPRRAALLSTSHTTSRGRASHISPLVISRRVAPTVTRRRAASHHPFALFNPVSQPPDNLLEYTRDDPCVQHHSWEPLRQIGATTRSAVTPTRNFSSPSEPPEMHSVQIDNAKEVCGECTRRRDVSTSRSTPTRTQVSGVASPKKSAGSSAASASLPLGAAPPRAEPFICGPTGPDRASHSTVGTLSSTTVPC